MSVCVFSPFTRTKTMTVFIKEIENNIVDMFVQKHFVNFLSKKKLHHQRIKYNITLENILFSKCFICLNLISVFKCIKYL